MSCCIFLKLNRSDILNICNKWMFLLFSMIKNSFKNRVFFLFFKYLLNLFLLFVYFWGNLDLLKNLCRLVYYWSMCRYSIIVIVFIYWVYFVVDYFWFYFIFVILIILLFYNNGLDFFGSNNRVLFSLLVWYWLIIWCDFLIDIWDKYWGFF